MINHPLIQKEWKNIRWIMLIFLCVYTVSALILNQNMQGYKETYLLIENPDSIFIGETYAISQIILPIILIGIITLVVLLFHDDRNINVGRFIGSLPFSRKKQFIIKYLIGVLTFSIPLFIYGVAICAIRISHEKWINYVYKYQPHGDILIMEDSIGNVLLWICLVWLIMISLYSFSMFIQTIMGQNIIAGVIGGIIYLVPWFLAFAIPTNIALLTKKIVVFRVSNIRNLMNTFLLGAPHKGEVYNTQLSIYFDNQYSSYYFGYEYSHIFVGIMVLIAITIISSLLAYYFMQKGEAEKIGDIVMFPVFQKTLLLGVTICSGLLLPVIIVVFTQIDNNIIALVSMIIGGILGYFITRKSNELTRKHG